jgi:hypothetical protein
MSLCETVGHADVGIGIGGQINAARIYPGNDDATEQADTAQNGNLQNG